MAMRFALSGIILSRSTSSNYKSLARARSRRMEKHSKFNLLRVRILRRSPLELGGARDVAGITYGIGSADSGGSADDDLRAQSG
jgi:hypothetical protein